MSQAQVERIRDLMNSHVRDCLVKDYEDLIPALNIPRGDDRHVLVAANQAVVGSMVTLMLLVAAVAIAAIRWSRTRQTA